jgi:ESS family glutamate:Na+ symporter
MGVTATGLLLLRAVDPESETDAPSAFGYKQLLHEPIMGGGLWTSMAIPLVILQGGWFVFIVSASAIAFWFIVMAALKKRSS